MRKVNFYLVAALTPLLFLSGLTLTYPQRHALSDTLTFTNGAGTDQSITIRAQFDSSNPFFQPLGSNARACSTCHQPNNGWSIRPETVQTRFDATQGLDPIFLPNDGTNAPNVDMSTLSARMAATTMLRTRGTIRVGLPIPANAEFELIHVNDPYGYASSKELSLFRRPLPTTNLKFLSSVMWDNRETVSDTDFEANLEHQAIDAVSGHAQGVKPPTQAQLQAIVSFETGIFTTQITDAAAGSLTTNGALSGPQRLSQQPFHPGINDPFGNDPMGPPVLRDVFTLFANLDAPANPKDSSQAAARKAIGRGETVFNTKTFVIDRVPGLNDRHNDGNSVTGTCGTCHNTPNVGSHSSQSAMNTGISDPARVPRDFGGLPPLPVYTLRNKQTMETITTTDPGQALLTGKWSDINKFKVPSLRGIESRSPYMHNGFTGDINDILDFYSRRFHITFKGTEKADLKAFLEAL